MTMKMTKMTKKAQSIMTLELRF
ncbi:hypothetical protein CCACVL1_19826 [Corchorus capsularis]|uniref:Uncharacterized protein n=1 Tax=Corchorus capsularis TaxID=210143 RepID=A0A1R3HEL1_COCAP|nr:hypothetical protein CCACVL1_19826 [Corchorus capsularis]